MRELAVREDNSLARMLDRLNSSPVLRHPEERTWRNRVLTPAQTDERLTMTYEEFLDWADEDTRAEWVDGEVIVFMPPKVRHADVVVFLVNLVSYIVRRRGLGRVLAAALK